MLEIGGGVGEIQLELLKRGAATAVNLELSPAYDAEAQRLLREAGLEPSRVDRRLHDIAAAPGPSRPPTSWCSTGWSAATPTTSACSARRPRHARRLLVFSHPRRKPSPARHRHRRTPRCALRGKEFRAFAHPPAAMLDVLPRAQGLSPPTPTAGAIWQVEGLSR